MVELKSLSLLCKRHQLRVNILNIKSSVENIEDKMSTLNMC